MSDTNEAVLREFQRVVWSSPQPIPRGRSSAFSSPQDSPTVQFPMEISEEDSRQDAVSEGGVSVRSSYSSPSQSTSQTEDLPNFNIDLYRDLVPSFDTPGRLIGQGAFATVFEHEYKGKKCAVKFFDIQYQFPLEDQEQQDMFTRELYRHCLVYHPNIVKLLGANSSPGNRCIITEHGGECLYKYIREKKDRLSYRNILKITRGVAQALEHLHDNDIVHRDLHPGNVVIENGHAKVLDVGIAKILQHTSSKDSQVKSGWPLGSFGYLAPEIFLGEKINCKVDIFALGLIMLEMWTRQSPWGKLSVAVICHKITSGECPEIPDDMPTVFSRLISDCLQKVRDKRPSATKIARVCDAELEKNPSMNQS